MRACAEMAVGEVGFTLKTFINLLKIHKPMQTDLRDTSNTTAGSNGALGQASAHKIIDNKAAGEFILTNPAAEPLQPTSVGELLQAARVQAGLSVADVANRLRMGVKQVDALERADYSVLPAGTFLRGFVRNYAKAVGVNVDEALTTLERTHKNAAALAASVVVAPTIAASAIKLYGSSKVLASPKARLLVTFAVVLLLAAAVWYWWANVRPYMADGGRAKPADTSLTAAATNEYTLPSVTTNADSTSSTTTSDAVSQPSTAGATPTIAPEAALNVAPADTTDAGALKKSDAKQVSGVAGNAPISPIAATATGVAIAEPTPPILASKAIAGNSILESAKSSRSSNETGRIGFTFSGQSWVEVIDSTGRTILSRRYSAGETDEVAGRGPFSIVVGDATVTRMAYNGREFDLSPHRRGNSTVARVNMK